MDLNSSQLQLPNNNPNSTGENKIEIKVVVGQESDRPRSLLLHSQRQSVISGKKTKPKRFNLHSFFFARPKPGNSEKFLVASGNAALEKMREEGRLVFGETFLLNHGIIDQFDE
ncbi:10014_t:CDS:2, partial [Gigaspora margarita]